MSVGLDVGLEVGFNVGLAFVGTNVAILEGGIVGKFVDEFVGTDVRSLDG